MTTSATIRINVDPTNPGQFFACCGLLELADRLWDGAEGWFEEGAFCLAGTGSLTVLLELLAGCEASEVLRLEGGLEIKPLVAPLNCAFGEGRCTFVLDAWMAVSTEKGKPVAVGNQPWNFWSGQQTSLRIWRSLHSAFKEQLNDGCLEPVECLFNLRIPLSGRFGFDPGAAWNALDVGFSPNDQSIEVASSAVLELLAAIGVQRFRPLLANDRQSFVYATWGLPLPCSIASAAAAGVFTVNPSQSFLARVVSRGSYAALAYSTILSN